VQELLWAEEICRKDPLVKKACEEVGIDQSKICIDGTVYGETAVLTNVSGWCIGNDERFPGRRLQQCFVFIRTRPNDNIYAHPAEFVPVLGE